MSAQGPLSTWTEAFRRRGVLRALLVYGAVAVAVLLVADPVLRGLHLPSTLLTPLVLVVALGFPVVALLAWLASGMRRPASPGAYLARRQRRRVAALAGGLVLTAAVGWGVVHQVRRATSEPFGADPAIVVLPFTNIDQAFEEEYFVDGMTDEIQAALSRIPGLRVMGRTTTFALRSREIDVREVGRKLGVTAVLQGSVRRSGPRLRVLAQVVDARDGYQIWSETFERNAADVLAVQDEIGRAVARALEIQLLPRRPGQADGRSVDPEAYAQYLLARQLLGHSDLDGYVRAAAASERAIEIAPDLATAWVTLSVARAGMADYVEAPDEIASNRAAAQAAVERALELDPDLAMAYAARAQLETELAWNWEAAGQDFDRALALAPGDADILRKRSSWYLAPQGRLSEAIDGARRSTELDPLSARSWATLGYLQVAASRGAEGATALRRALEIDSEHEYAREALGVRQLLLGNPAAALAETERCASGTMWRMRGRALAEHSLGHREEAAAALAAFKAEWAAPSPYQVAEIHAWRGEADEAIAWLEKAVAARDPGLLIFQVDPLLDPIRDDPRIASVRRRLNLPDA